MILKIKSENPRFADIIMKNPLTNEGLDLYKLKNGCLVGHYETPQEYHCVFQDTKYSYSNEDKSNQLDTQSHCNPRVALDIINTMFDHILKDSFQGFKPQWLESTMGEMDVPFRSSCGFLVNIDSNWASKDGTFVLAKYFEEIKLTHRVGNLYFLEIGGEMTINRLINLTSLVALMLTITNEQHFYIEPELIKKYIRVMRNIGGVPYFVVYLFKVRLLAYRDKYDLFAEELQSLVPGLQLTHGNTHDARKTAIFKELGNSIPILDVGCGEFQYAKMFLNNSPKHYRYYCVDRDESLEKIAKAINNRYAGELVFKTDIHQHKIKETVNIVLTEVIEHNTHEEALQLLQDIVGRFKFSKIMITTVNANFNIHYNIDGPRREDHVFEMGSHEFSDFIGEFAKKNNLDARFTQIGDRLGGVCPTSAAVLVPKHNLKTKITNIKKSIKTLFQ